ncbi:unnamed protein product [Prorocentrum cordatum]|uniref:Beta-glucosidase n=1 Tax=Prorocentrum cordatum TaxID=2364126 RepID=A0ABN9SYH1_9DINO|nr:unnamed protein product [Polarella glacialis]
MLSMAWPCDARAYIDVRELQAALGALRQVVATIVTKGRSSSRHLQPAPRRWMVMVIAADVRPLIGWHRTGKRHRCGRELPVARALLKAKRRAEPTARALPFTPDIAAAMASLAAEARALDLSCLLLSSSEGLLWGGEAFADHAGKDAMEAVVTGQRSPVQLRIALGALAHGPAPRTFPAVATLARGRWACSMTARVYIEIAGPCAAWQACTVARFLKGCWMDSMGLKHYRLSISWSRLVPTGKVSDGVNEEGKKFYSDLIDALLAAGITPYVTLYHWDLPQGLLDPPRASAWWSRDADGRPSGEIVPDWLAYVEVCFSAFGDRVKHWITFNEPWSFTFLASGYGAAPGIDAFSNQVVGKACPETASATTNGGERPRSVSSASPLLRTLDCLGLPRYFASTSGGDTRPTDACAVRDLCQEAFDMYNSIADTETTDCGKRAMAANVTQAERELGRTLVQMLTSRHHAVGLHTRVNALLGMELIDFRDTQCMICENRTFLRGSHLRTKMATDTWLDLLRPSRWVLEKAYLGSAMPQLEQGVGGAEFRRHIPGANGAHCSWEVDRRMGVQPPPAQRGSQSPLLGSQSVAADQRKPSGEVSSQRVLSALAARSREPSRPHGARRRPPPCRAGGRLPGRGRPAAEARPATGAEGQVVQRCEHVPLREEPREGAQPAAAQALAAHARRAALLRWRRGAARRRAALFDAGLRAVALRFRWALGRWARGTVLTLSHYGNILNALLAGVQQAMVCFYTLTAYSVIALPVLSFGAKLDGPPPDWEKTEVAAIRKLFLRPGQWCCPDDLRCLQLLGFPKSLPDLRVRPVAAQCRVAHLEASGQGGLRATERGHIGLIALSWCSSTQRRSDAVQRALRGYPSKLSLTGGAPRPRPREIDAATRRGFQRAACRMTEPDGRAACGRACIITHSCGGCRAIPRPSAIVRQKFYRRWPRRRRRKFGQPCCSTFWKGWCTKRQMEQIGRTGCIFGCAGVDDSIEHCACYPADQLLDFLLLDQPPGSRTASDLIRRALRAAAVHKVHNFRRRATICTASMAREALLQAVVDLVAGHLQATRALGAAGRRLP